MNLRRRRLGALAASALAIGSTLVARADESLEWLARMNQAVDGMNYVGTFVHLSGKESHASRVVHRAKGGALGERVVSLDGEEREVIRTASETRCILPAQRVVIVDRVRESSLRAALPEYRGGIGELYRIVSLGQERVSGRPARRILVSPRDHYRYGYQLWLDLQTAMPLKTMTMQSDGRVVELVQFTEIDFPPTISDDQLAPTLLAEDFTVHQPAMLQASPNALAAASDAGVVASWTAARLPRGFRLSGGGRSISVNGQAGHHLVYSDGLAAVSVFIEQLGQGAAAMGSPTAFADLGASTAFSRVVGSYQIVVVGEVPADTVTLIGRSMRRQESATR